MYIAVLSVLKHMRTQVADRGDARYKQVERVGVKCRLIHSCLLREARIMLYFRFRLDLEWLLRGLPLNHPLFRLCLPFLLEYPQGQP